MSLLFPLMSEFNWIKQYFAPLATRKGAAGLVDDAAELSGKASVVTVDALVEGVHFLPDDPIDTVARKLVRVNVSDMIAKGARPDEALLTLGWPAGRDEAELAQFAKALGEELGVWGASLIGGDTAASPNGLFLSLTLTGVPTNARAPIRRSGAQLGDLIWVSGRIGGGALGLADARQSITGAAADYYRVPEIPELNLADLIAAHASASMDISDGLLADAQKLLAASGCAGSIALEKVPVFGMAAAMPLEAKLALCTGGDDYQCLFCAPEAETGVLLESGLELSQIGVISAGEGLSLTWEGGPLELPQQAGFEHNFS
ncbi:MAG: thiamine-phosphate kinase [Hyphomonadaceae bacterium]